MPCLLFHTVHIPCDDERVWLIVMQLKSNKIVFHVLGQLPVCGAKARPQKVSKHKTSHISCMSINISLIHWFQALPVATANRKSSTAKFVKVD